MHLILELFYLIITQKSRKHRMYTFMYLPFNEWFVLTVHSKEVLVKGGKTTLHNNSKLHQHK